MKKELFHLLKERALEHKPVTLASGLKSTIYIDARQVYLMAQGQHLLGELFYEKLLELEQEHSKFDASGGMALGALALSCALAHSAYKRGRELPALVVRKEAKEHGTKTLLEGSKNIQKNGKIILVEDVITTGQSSLRAIEVIRANNFFVSDLICIVDREQGGALALNNSNIRMHALFSLKDFEL